MYDLTKQHGAASLFQKEKTHSVKYKIEISDQIRYHDQNKNLLDSRRFAFDGSRIKLFYSFISSELIQTFRHGNFQSNNLLRRYPFFVGFRLLATLFECLKFI